jgi:hypothetical protein
VHWNPAPRYEQSLILATKSVWNRVFSVLLHGALQGSPLEAGHCRGAYHPGRRQRCHPGHRPCASGDVFQLAEAMKKVIVELGHKLVAAVVTDNAGNARHSRELFKEVYPHIVIFR